jgi:hypothetical protein
MTLKNCKWAIKSNFINMNILNSKGVTSLMHVVFKSRIQPKFSE